MERDGRSDKLSFCQAHSQWLYPTLPTPPQGSIAPSSHTPLTLFTPLPRLANLPPLAWKKLLTFCATQHSQLLDEENNQP